MRVLVYALVITLAALSTPVFAEQRTAAPANTGETITVRLSNFDYTPDHLRLKAGVPVRLHLVNESSGRHDFSAPAFFAASTFPGGAPGPAGGDVSLGSEETVDVAVVPGKPGKYRLECTHFLHSLFGMHGTIEVVP